MANVDAGMTRNFVNRPAGGKKSLGIVQGLGQGSNYAVSSNHVEADIPMAGVEIRKLILLPPTGLAERHRSRRALFDSADGRRELRAAHRRAA